MDVLLTPSSHGYHCHSPLPSSCGPHYCSPLPCYCSPSSHYHSPSPHYCSPLPHYCSPSPHRHHYHPPPPSRGLSLLSFTLQTLSQPALAPQALSSLSLAS